MFATVEEEARFWDTHDSGKFEDEFELVEVEVEVANPLGHVFMLRLDAALLTRLHVAARQAGVKLSTYAADLLRRREQPSPPTN